MNGELEKIGFYTLSDNRARNISTSSPLWRCELLLTDRCNFKCPYCRGANEWTKGTLSFDDAKHVMDIWSDGGLKNVRFSGGEPTLVPYLSELVGYAKSKNIERIAVSSNGSADLVLYDELINAGVNDFSISLDACCASTGDTMAGGICGAWKRVIDAIRFISKRTYISVGVVLTDSNFDELPDIVRMASELGVTDVRIISAAQWNDQTKFKFLNLGSDILDKHPILKYRVNNFRCGRNVRGIKKDSSHRCWLALDDMVIAGEWHFPCVIAMREGCKPIGSIKGKTIGQIREERREWMESCDTHENEICKRNCLDVCQDFINTVEKFKRRNDV
ncbi:MAG: radical SAM protein [Candidatus Izemoplasmatales bacterium]